jgi:hypothetical protein
MKKKKPLLRLLAKRRKRKGRRRRSGSGRRRRKKRRRLPESKKRRGHPLKTLKLDWYRRRTLHTTASRGSLALHLRNSRPRLLVANPLLQGQRLPKVPVPLLPTLHVQPALMHRALVMPSLRAGQPARSTLRVSHPSPSSAVPRVQRLPYLRRRNARPMAVLKPSPHRRRRSRFPRLHSSPVGSPPLLPPPARVRATRGNGRLSSARSLLLQHLHRSQVLRLRRKRRRGPHHLSSRLRGCLRARWSWSISRPRRSHRPPRR